MKKILVYILILVFNFNQVSYSSTIISKKHISTFLKDCTQISDFKNYKNCFYNNLMSEKPALVLNNIIKNKKESDLINLLEISEIIDFTTQQEFISNETAFNEWFKITNSDYKKKFKKTIDFDQIINDSSCINYSNFEKFIKCFYIEFRNLEIYKSSDLITKRRIETIMLNSLNLTDDYSVILLNKENLFENIFDLDDGFEYFFITMNGFGTDFYNKRKLDIDYKKIITFIVIAVIVALVAKKLLTKSSFNFTSNSSSASSASSGSSAASKNYLYKNLPKSHFFNKPWFRYTLRLRGF